MARPTDWVDTLIEDTTATQTTSPPISLLGGLTLADMRGLTLIRTIIRLSLSPITTAGAWGVANVTIGIGVTSRDAFGIGAAAVPDPGIATDTPPRGWVYRTAVGVSQNGVGTEIIFPVRDDVRGARKTDQGELFLRFNNNPTDGQAFGVELHGLVRCLFKLA